MSELYTYYGKQVELTYLDGEVIKGVVDLYTSADDDEDLHEESISIKINDPSKLSRWVYKSEIRSIKELNYDDA